MKIILQYFKLNFLSLLEYKIPFLIEVVAMLVNNSLFISIWYMFFMKFWTIWWMEFGTFAMLLSIMVMVFGIMHVFFWWYNSIWLMIEQWKIDSHLLLPKNILLRLLANKINIWAFWDIIFSFMLMYFIPNITIWIVLKIIIFSIIWSFVFLWFMLIFVSLSFFIWSSKNIVKWMFESVLWPSHYPPWILEWTIIKYFFMTIIPVFYVVFLPYNLLQNFTWYWFFILICSAIFFMSLWIFVFYKWLEKYESGNMLNTNI